MADMSKIFKIGLLAGGVYLLWSKVGPSLLGTSSGAGPSISVWTANGNPSRLQAGEAYRVTVTGPPNAPVDVTATKQGGAPLLHVTGATQTNAGGNLVYSGNADGANAGAWVEQWAVGGVPAGSWSFTILAPGMSALPLRVPTVFVGGRAVLPRFRMRGA
jgi:hypothetical protein